MTFFFGGTPSEPQIEIQELVFVDPIPKALPVERKSPSKTFEVETFIEGGEEGWERAAFVLAAIIAGFFFIIFVIFGSLVDPDNELSLQDRLVNVGVSFVLALLILLIAWYLLHRWLGPEELFIEVPEGKDAVPKVGATHMALFGIVSVAVYKFFSKKNETPKKQETASADARTDELVNFIA